MDTFLDLDDYIWVTSSQLVKQRHGKRSRKEIKRLAATWWSFMRQEKLSIKQRYLRLMQIIIRIGINCPKRRLPGNGKGKVKCYKEQNQIQPK
jgi:hypothetical protein